MVSVPGQLPWVVGGERLAERLGSPETEFHKLPIRVMSGDIYRDNLGWTLTCQG